MQAKFGHEHLEGVDEKQREEMNKMAAQAISEAAFMEQVHGCPLTDTAAALL